MEKLEINYKGSGIKTLRVIGWSTLPISAISCLLLMTKEQYAIALYAILSGVFLFSVSMAISTIAENALFQKSKLIHDLKKNEIEISVVNNLAD